MSNTLNENPTTPARAVTTGHEGQDGRHEKTAHRRPPLWRRLLRWTEHCLALFGVFVIVYHLCFELSVVVSPSMSPTLRGENLSGGDWVLMERVSYAFRDPHRWEVVGFLDDDGVSVMKRVVALPGENVSIVNNKVAIDGRLVEMPASIDSLEYLPYGNLYRHREEKCKDGYYLLGDETRDSLDSRFKGPCRPRGSGAGHG